MSNNFLKQYNFPKIEENIEKKGDTVKDILPLCPKCNKNDMVSSLNTTGYIGEKLYKCHRCGFDNNLVFSGTSTKIEQIESINEILSDEN